MLWVWCIHTAIRSFSDDFFILYRCPLLFGSFFGLFFFQSLVNREFLGVWKNKRYEKYVGKEEEDMRAAG